MKQTSEKKSRAVPRKNKLSAEMRRVVHEIKDHHAVIDLTRGRTRLRWITKRTPKNKHAYNTHSYMTRHTLDALHERKLIIRDDDLLPPDTHGWVIATFRYNTANEETNQ